MNEIICPIDQLSAEHFLEEYWQKQPLVIRQAFPGFSSPISPEELAGLACEDDVNSRIVIEKGGDHPWQPIYGPMDDEVFAGLPESHWTLLVNDVEKHLPELAWIVDKFRFIPEWRIDDLMISYAPLGGSVGPHMDLYDVFILQADGHRRWQLNSQPVSTGNQVADTPLRIQKEFVAEHEWLLEPGDIIYIPPGVSHYGVATDDCMSYSIGFQASSHADLVNDFIAYMTRDLDSSLVYRDSDLRTQEHPNEITDDAIHRIAEVMKLYLHAEQPSLKHWFGRFVSDTRTDIVITPNEQFDGFEQLAERITAQHAVLSRHPASRYAFIRDHDRALLYIDGEEYKTSLNFAEILCHQRQPDFDQLCRLDNSDRQLLLELYNKAKLQLLNNEYEA